MQYDYERAAAIINAFRDLVMEIKSIDNACQTEIKEADMAFCDIRHKCEIDYPKNRSTRTKICRLMKEYSRSKVYKARVLPELFEGMER